VLNHLSELGLTNDEEFARQLVNEKIKRKPVGKRVLKQKLFEKGISKEITRSTLDKKFSEIDENELASESLGKYLPKINDLEKPVQRKKAFDHLARKGFDFDVIKDVIRENIK
jgi:regulatory protein